MHMAEYVIAAGRRMLRDGAPLSSRLRCYTRQLLLIDNSGALARKPLSALCCGRFPEPTRASLTPCRIST